MARRRQVDGEEYIEADNGFGWTPKRASVASVEQQRYETTVFGVAYELEKRRRNLRDESHDSGWYLYSSGVPGGFFGEWCGRILFYAVDEASKMIAEADFRGEGYERKDA